MICCGLFRNLITWVFNVRLSVGTYILTSVCFPKNWEQLDPYKNSGGQYHISLIITSLPLYNHWSKENISNIIFKLSQKSIIYFCLDTPIRINSGWKVRSAFIWSCSYHACVFSYKSALREIRQAWVECIESLPKSFINYEELHFERIFFQMLCSRELHLFQLDSSLRWCA